MRWLFVLLLVTALPAPRTLRGQEGVRIQASPDTVVVDQPFTVTISGLAPNQHVTMHLRLFAPSAVWETGTWLSRATYRATALGEVDLARAEPVSGSYTGIHPMGLVWAAVRDTGRGINDTITPGLERVDIALELAAKRVGTATVWRRTVALGVRSSSVADSGLVGSLYLPPDPGPEPGVLVLGGSDCGIRSAEHRAGLLASHGYAALALAYCAWPDSNGRVPAGFENLAHGVFEVPLEYVETGLRWLAARPEVDSGRIGLWGTSKGAELALLVAAGHSRVRAVVAVVPSSVVWQGLTRPWRAGSSWTHGGKPVPFVRYSTDSTLMRRLSTPDDPTLAHMYWASLYDTAAVRRATIPVERIDAPILLISGEDDTLWPSSPMAEMIVRRMREQGSATPYAHIRNDQAGHAIGSPYYPTTEAAGRLGGTPLGNALAQERSWRQALEFLDTYLKRGGSQSIRSGRLSARRRPGP